MQKTYRRIPTLAKLFKTNYLIHFEAFIKSSSSEKRQFVETGWQADTSWQMHPGKHHPWVYLEEAEHRWSHKGWRKGETWSYSIQSVRFCKLLWKIKKWTHYPTFSSGFWFIYLTGTAAREKLRNEQVRPNWFPLHKHRKQTDAVCPRLRKQEDADKNERLHRASRARKRHASPTHLKTSSCWKRQHQLDRIL